MKATTIIVACLGGIAVAAPTPPNVKYVEIPKGSTITTPDGKSVFIPQLVHMAIKLYPSSSDVKLKPRTEFSTLEESNDYEFYGPKAYIDPSSKAKE